MKHEASLQRFLRKFETKIFFNQNEYDKLFPSASVPARIYGTPKCISLPLAIHFLNFIPLVSSVGTFNYDLSRFLRDLLAPVAPDDYSCKDTLSSFSSN